jgi:MFS family permease
MRAGALTLESTATSTSREGIYKWWVVFMLWFVCFFNYADRQALSSVLPLLGKEFRLDEVQLGLLGSAFAWVYAAAAPLAGMTADRFMRKRLILGACVVWSLFTVATAWSRSFSWLFVVRALTGLGETFYFPAAMALLSDYHDARTRSRAMSWHQSAVYGGTILGSWLAAVLAERSGWRFPFFLFGPAGILLSLVLALLLREPRWRAVNSSAEFVAGDSSKSSGSVRPRIWEGIGLILRSPAALLLMGAFLCANFVAVIFLTWTPAFLVDKFNYSLGAAGLTGVLYIHLASGFAVPLAGGLADRWEYSRRGGRMLVQMFGLLVGAAFVFWVGKASDTISLVFAMCCFGICKGFYDSGIFASLYDVIDPRARGAAAGLMNTVGWGGGALGPLFVGLACKYGHRATRTENMSDAIAFCGLIYLLAAGLVLWARLIPGNRPAFFNREGNLKRES